MSEFSDFSLGKKKNNVKVNLDEIKGGIKAEALDKELYSIFNKSVNTDENEILDKEEIDNFINEIKAYAKDNNFSLGEAAKYLKEKNLKDINPEKLYSFISNLSQASENILESSVITANDGNKTFFIKYKDTSEETIYPDKTSKIEFKGLENELITKNMDASGKKISEIVLYEDKSKRTTVYEDELPKEETFEKDGTITIITYEKGSKKAKSVKTGETVQNFEYINGQEKLTYSKKYEDKKWIEETNSYNEDGKIAKSVVSSKRQNSDRTNTTTIEYKYHTNAQISEISSEELETDKDGYRKTILVKTFDETGNRLKLSESEDSKYGKYGYTHSDEINYDKNGNIVGYVPQNATLERILKDLEIEKDTELYEKFIELNKDSIKSFKNGKVKGFDVGAKIIIPGEVEEKAISYTKVNPKEEIENYNRDNLGKADTLAIPTEVKTIEKDTTWWNLARQNLIDLGNSNPTKAQIAENMNLLITLNHAEWHMNDPIKKGEQITVRVKESDNILEIHKLETYNIETLKKNYPPDKYQIKRVRVNPKQDEWGSPINPIWAYHIYDKSTNKEILSVVPKFVDDNGNFEKLVATYFSSKSEKNREIIFGNYLKTSENVYRNGTTYHNIYDNGKLERTIYTDPKTKRIVEIENPASPEKKIYIKKSEVDIEEIRQYKNNKLYRKDITGSMTSIYYNTDGSEAYNISWQKGGRHLKLNYPALKNFCKYLRTGNTAEAQKIMQTINKDNYKIFMLAYVQNYKKDFLEEIKNSKINSSAKAEFIKKFRGFTNEEFKITTPHRVVQNPTGGDKYSIDLNGDILTVKNQRTGKVSKIDFNNILPDCSEFEKARLKKFITEKMPPGVLEDLAVEVRKLKVQPEYEDNYASDDMETAGTYNGKNDYIDIGADEIYSLENKTLISVIADKNSDIADNNLIEIITHEIGHAIDYNGYIFNTNSSAGGKFYEAFKKERKEYQKAGKEVFNPDDKDFKIESDYKFNEETGELETHRNSVYATRNEREMFAECYAIIMLGDCQSKEHIQKYFPETFKAAKELLREIRQKSDNERQNRFHF